MTDVFIAGIGHKYLIKGTIKNHEEYRGAKQTVITRCKVVDDFIERNIEVITNKAGHEHYKIEEVDPFDTLMEAMDSVEQSA